MGWLVVWLGYFLGVFAAQGGVQQPYGCLSCNNINTRESRVPTRAISGVEDNHEACVVVWVFSFPPCSSLVYPMACKKRMSCCLCGLWVCL